MNPFLALLLHAALPFLPYAAGRAAAALLARTPTPARIRRARTLAGILFTASCLLPMAIEGVAQLAGKKKEIAEGFFMPAVKGWKALADPLGLPVAPGFVFAAYLIPVSAVFFLTLRLDQSLARRLDPGRVGRPFTAGKSFALLLFILLPGALIGGAVFAASLYLPEAGTVTMFVTTLTAFTAVISLFSAATPLTMRLFNHVAPLPEGPLCTRLERLAAAAGVRVRGFYTLESKEFRIANAFVTGIVPGTREVHLTPALLESLKEEEIEAIVAHEFGHLKARHLPAYLLFSFAWFFAFFGLLSFADIIAEKTELLDPELMAETAAPTGFAAFLLYFVILFRLYSRAFEREADRIAARLVGGTEALAAGLAFVYDWNRMPHHAGRIARLFMTHDALESRLADLRREEEGPPVSKWRMPAAILLAGACLIWLDMVYVHGPRRVNDLAWRASGELSRGGYAEAERLARRALAADPAHAEALHALGVALAKRGLMKEGEEMIRRAAGASRPPWWAAWNLAALAAGRGDYEVALAALAPPHRAPLGMPARAGALLADMIRWRTIYVDAEYYDNIKNDTKRSYIENHDHDIYDVRTSHVVYLRNLLNTGIFDPFPRSRDVAEALGTRLFDVSDAARSPSRFGPDAHEILAFLGVAARAVTTAVLISGTASVTLLPAPFDSLDGFDAPPAALLQFSGSFPLAGPLDTRETRLLGSRGEGRRPVLLYDGTAPARSR